MSDLDKIERALEEATPGPWEFDDEYPVTMPNDRWRINEAGTGNALSFVLGSADNLKQGQRDANARLIANTPTWLAELVEEVKRLRTQQSLLASHIEWIFTAVSEADDKGLTEELRKAVNFVESLED